MDTREVHRLLGEAEVVPCLKGALAYVKQLRDKCVGSGIPAEVGAEEQDCGVGCTPKVYLMVRKDDVPRVAELMQSEWASMVESEGTVGGPGQALTENEDGDLPCPACGTAAPLVDGCCSDCGLNLE